MNISDKMPSSLNNLAVLLRKLAKLYVENVKLTAAEKISVILSAGVWLVVLLVIGVFALAFLSGALIELMSLLLPAWACYLSLVCLFVLIGVVVTVNKKRMIVDPITRFVCKVLLESDDVEPHQTKEPLE